MKNALLILVVAALSGCASKVDYVPPQTYPARANSIEIPKPRQEAWKAAVPAIGRRFFVINTLDQSSGLMNLSYSGDPEVKKQEAIERLSKLVPELQALLEASKA